MHGSSIAGVGDAGSVVMHLLEWHSWPELVFHVLAHLPDSVGLPASAFDAGYCAFVAARVGAADARPLRDDIAFLQRLLPDHASLAHAQLLAWLFDDTAQALAVAEVDLAALSPAQVARPAVLKRLQTGPVASDTLELLRCAALLEQEVLAQLPTVNVDASTLQHALARVGPAAPQLARLCWRPVRALRQRGRVALGEVWSGVPDETLALSAEHVAWQVAHEATVDEVAQQSEGRQPEGGQPSEREVERTAVRLLYARAAAAGLTAEHARWLATLHPSVAQWCAVGDVTHPF